MAKKDETKTYFVERDGGRHQRVTVPASWKVTFGPLVPGKNFTGAGNNHPALRFWESANQQRMVITDVKSFRDVSIKVEERRTQMKQQRMTQQTEHGAKDVIVEGSVSEWVDPDAPNQGDNKFMRAITQDES